MRRTGWVVLVLAAAAFGRDRRAQQLAEKAVKIAKAAKPSWTKFILDAPALTDDELDDLIDDYEKAVDLFQKSLAIEEHSPLHGSVLVLTRRLPKLMLYRQRRQYKPPPPPEPKQEEEDGDAPDTPEPAPKPPPPPPEPVPEPIPPPRTLEDLPTLQESKSERRRGIQSVRNFVMNAYFPNRKVTALRSRCSVCNGSGRRRTGRMTPERKAETVPCPSCHETGAHLNESAARMAFWLTRSPLYRSKPENLAGFRADVEAWSADPRTIPEFLSKVKIKDVDYHGLWAKVQLEERGLHLEDKKLARFDRETTLRLFRLGRSWFLYDDEHDRALFEGGDEEADFEK